MEYNDAPSVLIVDDLPQNLVAFQALLAPLNMRVQTACSGAEALKLLMAGPVDMLMLDVQMPGMDGFELATLVRMRKGFQTTPIIFVTAHDTPAELLVLGYRLGAVDFMVKPLVPELVLAKVSALLEHDRVRRELAAAEQALRLRDQFISVATHEIRTPITAMLGYVQLLQQRLGRQHDLSPRDQQALGHLCEQVRRLHELTNGLLDLSRLQAGHMELDLVPLDLAELADEAARELDPAERQVVVLRPAAPLSVAADPLRMRQIFCNLLGNAVKYSPSGGTIHLELRREATRALVVVRDEGIGIPQEALPDLFALFYRASNARARGIAGVGVGLAVVKELVALHGGSIAVESREGYGTTFTLSFPLLVAEARGRHEGSRRAP